MKRRGIYYIILLILVSFSKLSFAQDLIVKNNGDTIRAKVLEVGTNAVSFKKWNYQDGATFVENKSNIFFIKFKNGDILEFSDLPATNTNTASMMNSTNSSSTSAQTNSSTATANSQQDNGKVKIEMTDGKFYIDGRKVKRKEVDKQLATSKNPLVIVPLKAAKLTKTSQKIVKIASIPTTIGGGFSTLWTGVNMYNDIRRHRDNTSTYLGAFTSLFTTIALPITNKILKKKGDGMYGKIIDAYNITN